MITLLNRWIANARVAYARERTAKELGRLSDAQLLDVGLERGDIAAYVERGLPFVQTVNDEGRAFAPSLQGCG